MRAHTALLMCTQSVRIVGWLHLRDVRDAHFADAGGIA
jgi:hypothetical protein